MATTYELIASNILASSAASVTFSAIPSTFNDLVLKGSTRNNQSGPNNINIIFNGVSSGYSRTYLKGTGTGIVTGRGINQTVIFAEDFLTGSNYTSNTFGNFEIYIPNYLVSQNKSITMFGTTENNASAANMAFQASLFSNTAAITTIQLTSPSGTFDVGCSFYLYGIKNS